MVRALARLALQSICKAEHSLAGSAPHQVPNASSSSHAGVSYGPSSSASGSQTHAAFSSDNSSHAEVAYSPQACSGSVQKDHSSPSSSQQDSYKPAQSASETSDQEDGSMEGISDEGSAETGTAISMSHPNAAMLQSRQISRNDTSAAQASHSGKAEGEMEGTNDAGSADVKPVASMSHPSAALLQSDHVSPGSDKPQESQSGTGRSGPEATSKNNRNAGDGAKQEGSPEGISDEGTMQNAPASSMSHPSSAFKQSEQLRRNDTSATADRLASSAGASTSGFDPSSRVQDLIDRLKAFMQQHIYPSEHVFEAHAKDPATKWKISPLNEQLKRKAKAAGLWNLWLPADLQAKLTHLASHAPQEESDILLGVGLSNLVSFQSVGITRSTGACPCST